MAIKTRDELLASLRDRFGDDTSDETLALLEDVTDTFTDLEDKAKGDGKDWRAEAERIDAEWRAKYKERFFSGEKTDDEPDEPAGDQEIVIAKTYEDLFEVKE